MPHDHRGSMSRLGYLKHKTSGAAKKMGYMADYGGSTMRSMRSRLSRQGMTSSSYGQARASAASARPTRPTSMLGYRARMATAKGTRSTSTPRASMPRYGRSRLGMLRSNPKRRSY